MMQAFDPVRVGRLVFTGSLAAAFFLLGGCDFSFSFGTDSIDRAGKEVDISTAPVTDISSTGAQTGGRVSIKEEVDVGARGVVWATRQDPSIESNEGLTREGTGEGSFTSRLGGLRPGTQYYVRSYAAGGFGVAYGDEIAFQTAGDEVEPEAPAREVAVDTLQEEEEGPRDGDPNTVADVDGNVYRTVVIGDQEWMAENLRTSRFASGEEIESFEREFAWRTNADEEQRPARAVYDNDSDNAPLYGMMYNWFAVGADAGLCPEGWTVPTSEDWEELIQFVGGQSEGGALKSDRIKPDSPRPAWPECTVASICADLEFSNSSGFSGLPGGYRRSDGRFESRTTQAYWWSASEHGDRHATTYGLTLFGADIGASQRPKAKGQYVRCVRSAERADVSLPELDTGRLALGRDMGLPFDTAVLQVEVTDDGGAGVTARGVVWGTSPGPTLDDHEGSTTEGSGLGEFRGTMRELEPVTTYYARGYATNQAGTFYGEDQRFTTEGDPDEGEAAPKPEEEAEAKPEERTEAEPEKETDAESEEKAEAEPEEKAEAEPDEKPEEDKVGEQPRPEPSRTREAPAQRRAPAGPSDRRGAPDSSGRR